MPQLTRQQAIAISQGVFRDFFNSHVTHLFTAGGLPSTGRYQALVSDTAYTLGSLPGDGGTTSVVMGINQRFTEVLPTEDLFGDNTRDFKTGCSFDTTTATLSNDEKSYHKTGMIFYLKKWK